MSTASFTKSQRGRAISRSMRSSSSQRMGSIRCPIWRSRPTASHGKKNAPWPSGPMRQARQGFFPDGSRSFEDIDRLSIDSKARPARSPRGRGRFLSPVAAGRISQGPTGGAAHRCRRGRYSSGDARQGFFSLQAAPSGRVAAASGPRAARPTWRNALMSSGKYDGAIFTQGSPAGEETSYWFNLLIDTTLPICGNAAQRPQGQMSNDGPQNIVHSLDFISSRIWADEEGTQSRWRRRAAGTAGLCLARGGEGRCAAWRLSRDRRPWRHPRRHQP